MKYDNSIEEGDIPVKKKDFWKSSLVTNQYLEKVDENWMLTIKTKKHA